MAGVFVRLKLTVLRNSLRGRQVVLLVLGAVYGLLGALGTAVLPLLPADPDAGADLLAVLVAIWALGWIAGPVVLGGGDETIRPENFALLPIAPARLAAGMGAASLVGVAPLVTALAFTGHVWLGLQHGVLPALVGAVGLVLALVVVVLLSRVVVAALSAVLSSRRGQDVGILLASLGALAFLPLQFLGRLLDPLLTGESGGLGAAGTTLRALPTGWSALAVRGAAAGDPLTAVLPLLGLAGVAALLVLLWARLLQRRMTTAAVSAGPSSARGGTGKDGTSASRGPLGAVVTRELRAWRRDARRRSALLVAVLLGLLMPLIVGGAGSTGFAYAALWVAVLGVSQLANLYAMDGSAMWLTAVVPGAARADVRGRQLAWLIVIAPVVLLVAVLGPLVTGSTGSVPWLTALVPLLLGTGAGLVVLQSVYLPVPLPQGRGANPFASGGSGTGGGCLKGLSTLGFLLLLVIAAVPVVALLTAGLLAELPVL
ncbi:hypothetical protein IQ251_05205, partial [Saccharopolyspora sp. HNM0983]